MKNTKRPGSRLAFFIASAFAAGAKALCFHACSSRKPGSASLGNAPTRRKHLAENSKSRIQAEAAFLKIQTHALPGTRIISEADIVDLARDANTARLKELRLNREALDRAAATVVPPKLKMRRNPTSA
ncbi:hypothetical protein [Bosea sp. LjRoot9]|uniref:hypothetical protein n=1 Tax=Bosea sp. LjRoot9 TaxID=3342341 RepID=UPI003F4F9E41